MPVVDEWVRRTDGMVRVGKNRRTWKKISSSLNLSQKNPTPNYLRPSLGLSSEMSGTNSLDHGTANDVWLKDVNLTGLYQDYAYK
jgi:hypothetical protein